MAPDPSSDPRARSILGKILLGSAGLMLVLAALTWGGTLPLGRVGAAVLVLVAGVDAVLGLRFLRER